MSEFTSITDSVNSLCNKLNTLYAVIRLYADIAGNTPEECFLQTTVTNVLRTMDHLADQVEEISGLADAIQKQLYSKNRQFVTGKEQ